MPVNSAPYPSHRQPPRSLPGPAHVLRDFERSKIAAIQSALIQRPVLLSVLFLSVTLIWTTLISIGSAFYGDNSFAVNQSPHIAHFILIVGILIYPLRLIWVPVLGYALVYGVPYLISADGAGTWPALPGLTLGRATASFALNLGCGGLAGLALRQVYEVLSLRMRPYLVDLWTAIGTFFAFVLSGFVLVATLDALAVTLPAGEARALGFGGAYLESAVLRVLRGGVVAAAFMLTVIETRTRRDLATAAALSLALPALALVQTAVVIIDPMVDTALVMLAIALLLPVQIALLTNVLGISVYAALTGHFLNDTALLEGEAHALVRVSVALLMLTVLIAAIRSFHRHALQQSAGAVRRLGRVRDFAKVGILSVNLHTRQLRADRAAQRILQLPGDGPADGLIGQFDGLDRQDLSAALHADRTGAQTLLLRGRVASGDGPRPVIRLFLWYERAPSGDPLAYGLAVDVTDEHEQERKLKITLAELSQRQMKQAQMFSIISHELRTPASILSMLLDELDSGDDPARTRALMRQTTDQLLSILGDMRQAMQPDRNLPVTRAPCRPADLAESLRNVHLPMARDNGMRIALDLGPGAEIAHLTDATRLRQALSNILRNAILHSHGSEVTIRWRGAATVGMTPGTARLSCWEVTDNGIGIPDAEVERLFEPFERGGADARKRADGSGLGLFIARSAITLLGGRLEFFRPAGGGAGYRIELPEAPADEAAAPPGPTPDEGQTFPDLRVLLAEDNAMVAEITRTQLARLVGQVQVAANGKEALDIIARSPPDLLITDLFMPELDGDELIRALRHRGLTLPVVGLTAAVLGEDMDRLQAAGADLVLQKPMDMAALRQALARGLAGTGADRDAAE